MIRCKNPILPGFYPDPSICRVGEDYYLVNSSFEYFPGLPVFHSRNLAHWEQIANAIDRPGQLSLEKADHWLGLYAPTIRYHEGIYYIINTNVGNGGNFIITAENPAGPWSDPHYLGEQATGIDPSLFWDDDGTCWYVGQEARENGDHYGDTQIWIWRLDLEEFRLVGEKCVIADGFQKKAVWPEGPHLYKKDGYYYLLHAESGTEQYHCEVAARSTCITGPYEYGRANPILTHRHLGKMADVTCVGHADIVDDGRGNWYLVALACRPEKGLTMKGRETFLAKLSWEDGWPVVNPGVGRLTEYVEIPDAGEAILEDAAESFTNWDFHCDFMEEKLPLRFVTLRNPKEGAVSLTERPGFLRMYMQPDTLKELGHPSYEAVRLSFRDCTTETQLELPETAVDSGCAGLALYQSHQNHLRLEFSVKQGRGHLQVVQCCEGEDKILTEVSIDDTILSLRMEIHGLAATFSWKTASSSWTALPATADLSHMSTEKAGGFTGCTLGLFAAGDGSRGGYADFAYFSVKEFS